MTLTHILILLGAAALYVALLPERLRRWALFVGSIAAIYWLQPALRVQNLDFIFPTATLALVALGWLLSRAPDQRWTREDSLSAGLIAALVLLFSAGRYLVEAVRITPSRPPATLDVALAVIVVAVLLAGLAWVGRRRQLIVPAILFIIVLFAILKTTPLAERTAELLRERAGQPVALASTADLEWLGFSYVAFRLIHTLRDRQVGRLPALSLREYVTYAIFFPAFTAGPIDRAERFVKDLAALPGADPDRLTYGLGRITAGIAKKFILADSLALFALDASSAAQVTSMGGTWVLLYAYAFQLYFDFSGYTDIAIGIGQLFGITLPENFLRPYTRRNITLFWQSWHITLSNWVRFYVFSPLSRYLLMRPRKPSPTALALVGQLATMIVIGLWHGVTWPFVVWGVWHALGLFVHKVYSDRTRQFYIRLRDRPRLNRWIGVAGTLLTFHFVVIGWVWFALPEIELGWDVFLRLFGL